jgi:hypothetical protein
LQTLNQVEKLNASHAQALADALAPEIDVSFVRGGLTASGAMFRSASTDQLGAPSPSGSAPLMSNGNVNGNGNSNGTDALLTPDARRVRSTRTWLTAMQQRRGSALAARAAVAWPSGAAAAAGPLDVLRGAPGAAARAVARHMSVGQASRALSLSLLVASTGLAPRHRGLLARAVAPPDSDAAPTCWHVEHHDWRSFSYLMFSVCCFFCLLTLVLLCLSIIILVVVWIRFSSMLWWRIPTIKLRSVFSVVDVSISQWMMCIIRVGRRVVPFVSANNCVFEARHACVASSPIDGMKNDFPSNFSFLSFD